MNIATVLGGGRAWLARRVGAWGWAGSAQRRPATGPLHPRSRAFCSVPLALATVAILLGMVSGVVYADTVSDDGWVYASSTVCVKGRSELSHGSGGGRTEGEVQSRYRTPVISWDCQTWIHRPVGYLKVNVKYLYWTEDRWKECGGTGWQYNTSGSAWKMKVVRSYGSTPDCGSGYYGTDTGAYVNNGGWHGGWVWSGQLYLS